MRLLEVFDFAARVRAPDKAYADKSIRVLASRVAGPSAGPLFRGRVRMDTMPLRESLMNESVE